MLATDELGAGRLRGMRPITDDCFQLERSRGANGYVVRGRGRTAVIDPGMSSGYEHVLAELRGSLERTGPVTDLLLTHYDVDHAAAAARLQRALDVPVWISAPDAAILRGEVAPATRLRRLILRLAPITYPSEVRELTGAGEVFDGLTTFPTPGHTPGHVAYQWGNVLFTGDAVTVSATGELRQFFGPIISDKPRARATQTLLTERIAALGIEWVCAGHSAPARVRR